MDASTITILAAMVAIGVALAGLILRQGARLDARIESTNERIERTNERIERTNERIEEVQAQLGARIEETAAQLGARIEEATAQLGARIEGVERGQADLRERMAKLEGLLEGLREAIAGRRAA